MSALFTIFTVLERKTVITAITFVARFAFMTEGKVARIPTLLYPKTVVTIFVI